MALLLLLQQTGADVSDVSETIKRKLTTIFYADVVGFSRLMERDEEATLQTLRRYRETLTAFVERHHGRVVNTAGDSLLAEFARVVEAVNCAIEVQRELGSRNADIDAAERMEFRIGVNLGDVMIEGDDLYGEGVNVAARLQGLAEPGGICISGTVYDQVHNKLSLGFDFIGEQTVKNIAEPVPVYRLHLDGSGRAHAQPHEHGPRHRQHGGYHAQTPRTPSSAEITWARRVYLLFLVSVAAGFLALVTGIAFNRDGGGQTGKIDGDVTFAQDTVFRGNLEGSERYEPAPGAPADQAEVEAQMREMMAEMDDGATWRQIIPGILLFMTVASGLAGVILAYIHRGDGAAWTDSHYTFQIRTFWIGLVGLIVGAVLSIIFVGVIVLVLLPLWLLVRCGRGLNRLATQQPQPHPQSWAFG